MPSKLRAITRTDFSGGIDATSSPYLVGQTRVMRALNFQLDEYGAMNVRDGATTVDLGPDNSQRILSLASLSKINGDNLRLAIIRLANNTQHLYESVTGGWASRGLFTTRYDTPTVHTFLNRAVIAAGYEPIKTYDGSTFESITTGPPGAKYLAVHIGSLWAWNTNPTTTAIDGPSSLRASNVSNVDEWPPTNQVFISKDDGQVGMGLGVFTVAETGISPFATLVAFKNFSSYQISGLFPDDVSVVKARTDMGCVAPRSIQFVPTLGVVRLTHRGFATYTGISDTSDSVLSEPIRPYIFGKDDIVGLNWDKIQLSTAAQVENPPLYICACPTTVHDGLDRLFIYDVLRQAWTIATFPQPFSTVNLLLEPGLLPSVYAGEYGGRQIYRLFNGARNDDSARIPWRVRFQPIPPQQPLRRGYHRRMLLKAFRVQQGQAVTATMVVGPAQQLQYPRGQQTITRRFVVGASAPPDAPLSQSVEVDMLFDVGLTGELLYVELSGEGPISLRATEWHVQPKPLTRPMRA